MGELVVPGNVRAIRYVPDAPGPQLDFEIRVVPDDVMRQAIERLLMGTLGEVELVFREKQSVESTRGGAQDG